MKTQVDRERQIEAVLFDIGGVLLGFDHMKSCREIAKRMALTPPALTPNEVYERLFASGLETEFDLGLSTDLFYQRAIASLGISTDTLPFDDFVDIWGAIFEEIPEVTQIVAGLKGRARLFILSNTNRVHYSYIVSRFEWFKEFEARFLSFELGQRKPDRAIFNAVIESTGLAPSSILYFDDISGHVSAAKEAGIEAVLFTTPGAMKAELERAGL